MPRVRRRAQAACRQRGGPRRNDDDGRGRGVVGVHTANRGADDVDETLYRSGHVAGIAAEDSLEVVGAKLDHDGVERHAPGNRCAEAARAVEPRGMHAAPVCRSVDVCGAVGEAVHQDVPVPHRASARRRQRRGFRLDADGSDRRPRTDPSPRRCCRRRRERAFVRARHIRGEKQFPDNRRLPVRGRHRCSVAARLRRSQRPERRRSRRWPAGGSVP